MKKKKIDIEKTPPQVLRAADFLEKSLIGHKLAKRKLIGDLSIFFAGLGEKNKPIGARIFVGSSGVGKTYLAKLMAWVVLDAIELFDPEAPPPVTLINCSELQERHELSKLVGSPPGYVGFFDPRAARDEKNPAILSQSNIDEPHRLIKAMDPKIKEMEDQLVFLEKEMESLKSCFDRDSYIKKQKLRAAIEGLRDSIGPNRSVIIFDEFEKAHPNIWKILLQILEEGRVVLGSGEITSFRNSFIFLTSNLGQEQIKKVLSGKPERIGLGALEEISSTPTRGALLGEIVRAKVKKVLPTELLGRFGGEEEIIDFQPLKPEEVRIILALKIEILNKRLSEVGMRVVLCKSAEDFLVEKGYSPLYGARTMNAAIRMHLLKPLATIKNLYPDIGVIKVTRSKEKDELEFWEETKPPSSQVK